MSMGIEERVKATLARREDLARRTREWLAERNPGLSEEELDQRLAHVMDTSNPTRTGSGKGVVAVSRAEDTTENLAVGAEGNTVVLATWASHRRNAEKTKAAYQAMSSEVEEEEEEEPEVEEVETLKPLSKGVDLTSAEGVEAAREWARSNPGFLRSIGMQEGAVDEERFGFHLALRLSLACTETQDVVLEEIAGHLQPGASSPRP